MPREKVKFALRISPETQQLVKDLYPRDNCQSQNEFIEKAIRFYAGHVSAKDSADFLPPVFAATLKGIYSRQTQRRDEVAKVTKEKLEKLIRQMQT